MAIRVGEVEAVLTARDQMSPAFVQAAQKVEQLRVVMRDWSSDSKHSLEEVTRALATAEIEFENLRDAQNKIQQAAAETGRVASETVTKLDALGASSKTAADAAINQGKASDDIQSKLRLQTEATNATVAATERLAVAQETASRNFGTMSDRSAQAMRDAIAAGGLAGGGSLGAANSARLDAAMSGRRGSGDDLTGAAFMASLEAQAIPIGEEQRAMMDRLAQLDVLNVKNAERVGVNAVQYKEYVKSLKEANAALDDSTAASGRTVQSWASMESMATRLVERFILLSIVRTVADDLGELFKRSEQIAAFSDSSGMAIEHLQQLGYAAGEMGGNFEKVEGYVGHLNSTLGAMKIQTGDALKELNLGWTDVFSMNPDERFEAIAQAIAKLPDPIQRSRIEAQLFGTDAIDPLIMKLGDLEKQAPIMSDATVRAFATMKQAGIDVVNVLGQIADKSQLKIQLDFEAFWGGGPITQQRTAGNTLGTIGQGILGMLPFGLSGYADPHATSTMFANFARTGSLVDYSPNPNFNDGGSGINDMDYPGKPPDPNAYDPNKPGPHAIGQARLDYIRQQMGDRLQPGSANYDYLAQLRRSGSLTPENAQGAPEGQVTSAQLKMFEEDWSKSEAAARKAATATAEYNKAVADANSIGQGWRGTLDSINGEVVEYGKYLLAGGMSEGQVSKMFGVDYGLTEAQVRSISDAWKDDQKAQKDYASASEYLTAKSIEWSGQAAQATAQDEEGKYGRMRAAAETYYEENLNTLNEKAWVSQEAYDSAYNNLVAATAAKVKAADDAEAASADAKATRKAAAAQRAADAEARAAAQNANLWEQYYVAVEQASGTAADVQIANVYRQEAAAIKAIKESGDYAQSDLDAIAATTAQRISNIINSFDPLWKAWKQGNQDFRNEWANSWDKALDSEKDSLAKLVDAVASPFNDINSLFKKMLAGMLSDWEYQLLAPLMQSARSVIGDIFGMSPTGSNAGLPGGIPVGGNSPLGRMFGSGGESGGLPGGVGGGGAGMVGSLMSRGGSEGAYIQQDINSTAATALGGSRGMSMAGGGMMAAAGAYELYQNRGLMSDLMGGTEAGAGIGTMIMPGVGTAIGAGIGAVIGLARDLIGKDHTLDDIARDAGSSFGENWSGSLVKTVADNAKKFHDEVAGELASLPQIIAEHPVDASNLNMYIGKVHDLFSMLQEGKMSTQQVGSEIDQVFATLAKNATDAYGIVSEELKGLINLSKNNGVDSNAIRQFELGQIANVVSGSDAVTADMTYSASGASQRIGQQLDDVNAQIADLEAKKKKDGLTNVQTDKLGDLYTQQGQLQQQQSYAQIAPTQQDVRDLTSITNGSITLDMAQGGSKFDAIAKESVILTQLEEEYKRLGMTVEDESLKQEFMFNKINKIAPTLIPGIQGLQKEVAGLTNLDAENADALAEQERVGYDMYVKMQSQVAKFGGSTKDALEPMQGYLHAAEEAAKKLGVPLDENTQMMIDQSKDLGIWSDQAGKPGGTIDQTSKLAKAIQDLVDWLNKIPTNRDTTVTTHFKTDGTPEDPVPGSGGPPGNTGHTASGDPTNNDGTPDHDGDPTNSMSGGGVVYAAQGHYFQPKPKGSDTKLAMLTPGEGVISVPGMERLGEDGLKAINNGMMPSSPTTIGGNTYHTEIHWHSEATNGRELLEEAQAPGGLFDQMIMWLGANQTSGGTRLKRTLTSIPI